jgi:hypothetical protein
VVVADQNRGRELLAEASAGGVTMWADGDRLRVRGPKSAEALLRRLLDHKPDVLAALRSPWRLSATGSMSGPATTAASAPAPLPALLALGNGKPADTQAEASAGAADDFHRLTTWFRNATLPDSYTLGPRNHVEVDGPANRAWTLATIAANPQGQVRRALLARLRELYARFAAQPAGD